MMFKIPEFICVMISVKTKYLATEALLAPVCNYLGSMARRDLLCQPKACILSRRHYWSFVGTEFATIWDQGSEGPSSASKRLEDCTSFAIGIRKRQIGRLSSSFLKTLVKYHLFSENTMAIQCCTVQDFYHSSRFAPDDDIDDNFDQTCPSMCRNL